MLTIKYCKTYITHLQP